jgi:hypothetical protein
MEDTLISFETAKLANEKNFNIKGRFFYDKENELDDFNNYVGDTLEEQRMFVEGLVLFEAPTQSLLQKWIREVHKIVVFVAPLVPLCEQYGYTIYVSGKNQEIEASEFYKSYEKCLEKGLVKALKRIK